MNSNDMKCTPLDRLATHPEKRPQDETEDEMRARHRKHGYGNWPAPPSEGNRDVS